MSAEKTEKDEQTHVILYQSKFTGRQWRGALRMSREKAEAFARKLDEDYPEMTHTAVEE